MINTTDAVSMVEVRAIVRVEMLDRVVHSLKECGLPRLTVQHAHAIGSAVDTTTLKISVDEVTEYADMAIVRCICAADGCEMLTEIIARAARTGQPGDGIVSVHPVPNLTKIRTGADGLEALK
jgi:nitrogen regulatory protein PII